MSRNKTTTCYIREDQLRNLKLLSEKTKVPVAEYIRQGVELILQREELSQYQLPHIRKVTEGFVSGQELHLECGPPSPIPLPKNPLFPYGRETKEEEDGTTNK